MAAKLRIKWLIHFQMCFDHALNGTPEEKRCPLTCQSGQFCSLWVMAARQMKQVQFIEWLLESGHLN